MMTGETTMNRYWVLTKWLTADKTAKREWVEIEASSELEAASLAVHAHDDELDAQPVAVVAQLISHEYTDDEIENAVERDAAKRAHVERAAAKLVPEPEPEVDAPEPKTKRRARK